MSADSKEKQAVEVIRPYPKARPQPYMPKPMRASTLSLDDAKQIAQAMHTAAPHGALDYTRVELNGSQLKDLQDRMVENPRSGPVARAMARHSGDFAEMPNKTQMLPDAYLPAADNVWLPSGNPGTLMHELGHGIDINGYPNNAVRATIAGLYNRAAPTLWQEHAAWRKGEKYFLQGAAQNKLSPELVARVLRDKDRGRRVGLGSYWGAGLGATAGMGLGTLGALALLQGTNRLYPQLPLAGLALGGGLGSVIGGSMGHRAADDKKFDSPEYAEKYIQKYIKTYARQHKLPLEEADKIVRTMAAQKIQKQQAKKQKKAPTPMRKAANIDIMAKLAALSLTNLPIKQPSIDRAHSVTYRVEKSINKAKEEREKREMSTDKSASTPASRSAYKATRRSVRLNPVPPSFADTGSTSATSDYQHDVRRKEEWLSRKKLWAGQKRDDIQKAKTKRAEDMSTSKSAAVEFGRLVKSADLETVQSALIPGALGAGIGAAGGGLYGLATGQKGDRLRAALRGIIGGGLVGGGAGLGAGMYGQRGLATESAQSDIGRGVNRMIDAQGASPNHYDAAWGRDLVYQGTRNLTEDADRARITAGLLGGGIAGAGLGAMATKSVPKKKPKKEPTEEKQSAYNFGRLVKRAAGEMMQGGLAGAGLGALGGGLAGLMAPGEEEDEDGNVVRRGRLSGALRGALGGGALGGLAGAGMGHFAPGMTGQGVDYLKSMIGMGGQPKPTGAPTDVPLPPGGVKPAVPAGSPYSRKPLADAKITDPPLVGPETLKRYHPKPLNSVNPRTSEEMANVVDARRLNYMGQREVQMGPDGRVIDPGNNPLIPQ